LGRLLIRFVILLLFLLAAAALFMLLPLRPQQRVNALRADGREAPLVIYDAVGAENSCPPLAIISHGAGGSEDGYRYLALAMARNGFTTIVMGHRESGGRALARDMLAHGFVGGITTLVTNPEAESDRLLDVGAALKWSDSRCLAPFRVLLGHSMGAETVMLEAGAKNIIGVTSPPAGQDRFDAYVAMSPQGPGLVYPEQAWHGIHKPVLVLTGTRDTPLKAPAETRQIPWQEMPGDPKRQCQWLGVIDGARHLNFGGLGFGAGRVKPIVIQTIQDFLRGVRGGSCTLLAPEEGLTLEAK
jgi:predicted dienelactone hydrolase